MVSFNSHLRTVYYINHLRTVYYINIEKDKPQSGLMSKFCGKFAKMKIL